MNSFEMRGLKLWAGVLARVAAGLLAVVLVAPLGATAAAPPLALGPDGVLYKVLQGTYGELFPEGTAAAAEDPVLALEVTPPEAAVQRVLVPGTEGAGTETLAALRYEDASATLFLVWESADGEASRFTLSGFQAESWTLGVDVARHIDPRPGSLRIGLTRDVFIPVARGTDEDAVERTVLHLTWWELGSGAAADERVFYTPVVLLEGDYLGWNPLVALNGLDPYDGTEPTPVDAALRVPTVEAGPDDKAVIIAFTNPSSGRLVSVEVRALPGELGRISTDAARWLLEEGADVPLQDIEDFADGIRGMIVDLSTDLHPALRDYLSKQIHQRLRELIFDSGTPVVVLQTLAEGIRGQIVDLGSTFYGSEGRSRFYDPQRLRFVEIYSTPPEEGETTLEMPHLVRLYLVRERLSPVSGGEKPSVMVSEDGSDSLISWEEEGALHYRESDGDEWGEVRTLPLGEELDRELGQKILRERIRNH